MKDLKVIITDGSGNPIKDSSGKDVSVRLDLSGDELLNEIETNGGKLTFEIPSGMSQNIQVLCNDCAQNDSEGTNLFEANYKNVTVSTNILVIFFANKPLFFGSIAGVVLLAGGLWFFLFFRRKKATAKS